MFFPKLVSSIPGILYFHLPCKIGMSVQKIMQIPILTYVLEVSFKLTWIYLLGAA
jgi:hypothetical protein